MIATAYAFVTGVAFGVGLMSLVGLIALRRPTIVAQDDPRPIGEWVEGYRERRA